MILQSWRISSTHGIPRWWWVRVHDDAADLRRAAFRHAPHEGRAAWEDHRIRGCCQPVRPWTDGETDTWPGNGLAGVIRLSAEDLYTEVIYHELLHAACAVYRMNVAAVIELGDGLSDMGREEDLAYIYGQLAADMDTALKAWCG